MTTHFALQKKVHEAQFDKDSAPKKKNATTRDSKPLSGRERMENMQKVAGPQKTDKNVIRGNYHSYKRPVQSDPQNVAVERLTEGTREKRKL